MLGRGEAQAGKSGATGKGEERARGSEEGEEGGGGSEEGARCQAKKMRAKTMGRESESCDK